MKWPNTLATRNPSANVMQKPHSTTPKPEAGASAAKNADSTFASSAMPTTSPNGKAIQARPNNTPHERQDPDYQNLLLGLRVRQPRVRTAQSAPDEVQSSSLQSPSAESDIR